MLAYLINSDGFIEREIKCQESPLQPGVFLIPRGAVSKALPPLASNETVSWDGSTWRVVPDFSGKNYYSKGDGALKIFKKGESFSDLYIDVAPPSDLSFPSWNGSSWEQNHERHAQYLKSTKRALRISYLEATDKYLVSDYPASHGELELVKKYRTYIRDLPQKHKDWYAYPVLSLEEWKNAKA